MFPIALSALCMASTSSGDARRANAALRERTRESDCPASLNMPKYAVSPSAFETRCVIAISPRWRLLKVFRYRALRTSTQSGSPARMRARVDGVRNRRTKSHAAIATRTELSSSALMMIERLLPVRTRLNPSITFVFSRCVNVLSARKFFLTKSSGKNFDSTTNASPRVNSALGFFVATSLRTTCLSLVESLEA